MGQRFTGTRPRYFFMDTREIKVKSHGRDGHTFVATHHTLPHLHQSINSNALSMATVNPFYLLGDNDNDDPADLIAAHQQKAVAAAKKDTLPPPAKLPTKPLPPAQAVREAKANVTPPRAGGGRGGSERGRGGCGFDQKRHFSQGNFEGFSAGYGGAGGGEDGIKGRAGEREYRSYGGYRGGDQGGYGYVEGGSEDGRPPRRAYERHSGTGRGNEFKREGGGRGNWGTTSDLISQGSEKLSNKDNFEKQIEPEKSAIFETNKDGKENAGVDNEDKEEDKEMTIEEYEKIKEEKRKALLALKTEVRKVNMDKELKSMKQLSVKKGKDDVFIQLGSHKDLKKQKENADRHEKARKPVNINEFLKPAEGERYHRVGGRGRGRGRGDRSIESNFIQGVDAAISQSNIVIPIGDPGQFPMLGK